MNYTRKKENLLVKQVWIISERKISHVGNHQWKKNFSCGYLGYLHHWGILFRIVLGRYVWTVIFDYILIKRVDVQCYFNCSFKKVRTYITSYIQLFDYFWKASKFATVTFFVLSLLKLCNESSLNLNYER